MNSLYVIIFFFAEKVHSLDFRTQPKLLSLNLTNNLINEVESGAFANMTRLVRLILTRNTISELEEGSLAGKKRIKRFLIDAVTRRIIIS